MYILPYPMLFVDLCQAYSFFYKPRHTYALLHFPKIWLPRKNAVYVSNIVYTVKTASI